MHCDCTIETSMNGASFDVRLTDITFHMEMNWVAPKAERLTRISDLDVVEMSDSKPLKSQRVIIRIGYF